MYRASARERGFFVILDGGGRGAKRVLESIGNYKTWRYG